MFQSISYTIYYSVKTCVKVGRNGFYSTTTQFNVWKKTSLCFEAFFLNQNCKNDGCLPLKITLIIHSVHRLGHSFFYWQIHHSLKSFIFLFFSIWRKYLWPLRYSNKTGFRICWKGIMVTMEVMVIMVTMVIIGVFSVCWVLLRILVKVRWVEIMRHWFPFLTLCN